MEEPWCTEALHGVGNPSAQLARIRDRSLSLSRPFSCALTAELAPEGRSTMGEGEAVIPTSWDCRQRTLVCAAQNLEWCGSAMAT